MACSNGCGDVHGGRAHCGACHVTFAGVRYFDRHRKDGRCLDPAELGLTLKGSVWGTVMPTEALARLRGESGNPGDPEAGDS